MSGVFEQAKGRVKQAAGDLMGDRELSAEGEAQDNKGRAEESEREARQEAAAHEQAAQEYEKKQQRAENS